MENGTVESSGMGDLFARNTQHLSPNQIEYLHTWDRLIELEAAAKLPTFAQLLDVLARMQSGAMNPNLSHAFLRASGPIMAGLMLQRDVESDDGPAGGRLEAWGAMLSDSLDPENVSFGHLPSQVCA